MRGTVRPVSYASGMAKRPRCTECRRRDTPAAKTCGPECRRFAGPSRFEVRLHFENSELDVGPKEWPANGNFVLAWVGAGGELVDLTDDGIKLWMFGLGLDYILHR